LSYISINSSAIMILLLYLLDRNPYYFSFPFLDNRGIIPNME
jgi:hypothetical protein